MQIKETMQRYGYTPTTLAKKMGVFDSTVSRLVTGNPTVQKLQELAEQIGCQRWEFFLDELKAAGFEVVKKGTGPTPTGVGSGCAQGSGDEGIANADIQGSRIANPSEPGFGQQASELLRPAGSIICPSCGEIIKLGVLR